MVASRQKTLAELREDLFRRVGALYSRRVDHRLDASGMKSLRARMAGDPPGELDGHAVSKVDNTDGLKLVLEDGSWMLVRPSGTEPMVRQYVEARSETQLARLVEAGRRFVQG